MASACPLWWCQSDFSKMQIHAVHSGVKILHHFPKAGKIKTWLVQHLRFFIWDPAFLSGFPSRCFPCYTLCFGQADLFVDVEFRSILHPLTSVQLHILYPLPPGFLTYPSSSAQFLYISVKAITLCLVKYSFHLSPKHI